MSDKYKPRKNGLADVEKLYILTHFKEKGHKAIAKDLGRSASTILRFYHEEGLRSGLTGRFAKGREPWTKGKSWEEQGRSAEANARSLSTCFRKGHRPWNEKPIGSERVDKYGYTMVKVANGRKTEGGHLMNYRMKSRVEYEKANGPISPRTKLVRKDGDRSNDSLDNLMPVDNAEMGIANALRSLSCGGSPEIAIDVARIKRAKAKIAKARKDKKQ